MNDADRRRSPDSFDDDAIFADIVAHLNDDVAQEVQTTREADEPAGEDATAEVDSADKVADGPDGQTTLAPGDEPVGESRSGGSGHWGINPPPWPPKRVDASVDASVDPSGDASVDPSGDPSGDAQVDPAAQVWRAHEVDDEPEEHFEPPPVTPLPAGDLQFWAIIAGMTGGPLLLLYLVFFDREASSYWILAAIAMSVGGFAMLVSRMPGHRDDDDDGARL
ncbi:MAG: hypothetical protein ABI903_10560 [Actinomycetota bacterium]